MTAVKNFPVGSIFGLEDGMTPAQIKALEWMYSVKTTTKSTQANLVTFWENGSMMFKSTKSIRRGEKFVLLDDDTAKSPKKDSESELSDECDNDRNASRKMKPGTRKSSRTVKPNRNYYQKDNSSEDEKEENSEEDENEENSHEKETDESYSSSEEIRKSRRKVDSPNKSYRESDSDSEAEKDETRSSDDEEQRFTCNTCSKVFSNAPALKEHKKKHGPGIKMHSCDQCDRTFVYSASLEVHLKEEHKEKSAKNEEKRKKSEPKKKKKVEEDEKSSRKAPQKVFKCDECGKQFRWETSYEDHCAIHRKDFVCKICQKVFGKKIFLENHLASHENDKNKKKKGKKVVESSSDEEKAEESESEIEEVKFGRGKRKRKSVSVASSPSVTSSPSVARNRRKSAKRINYSMTEEDSDFEAEVKAEVTPKKMEEIDSDFRQTRSCYVKVERMTEEMICSLSDGDEDLHKCFKCAKVYKNERVWLNHMKKFHS